MTSKVTQEGEVHTVNPNFLFQRVVMSNEKEDNLKYYLSFELAPYPTSLFDGIGFRKTHKPKIYDLFIEINSNDLNSCVIDGGFLLHKVT